MKKTLLTISVITVALTLVTVVFFFIWTDALKSKIPYFGQLSNNTSLVVQSRNSRAKVEIDGKDFGETPVEVDTLSEGKHIIKMTRIADDDTFYHPSTFFVELNNNTEAFVNVEIGPDGQMSGYVLSYSPAPYISEDASYSVSSNAEVRIKLDEKEAGATPTGALRAKPGEHTIKTDAQDYDELEIPVVLRANFNLNIELYLLPIPVDIAELE